MSAGEQLWVVLAVLVAEAGFVRLMENDPVRIPPPQNQLEKLEAAKAA